MEPFTEFISAHGLTLESNPQSYRSLKSIRRIPKGTDVVYSDPLASFPIPSAGKIYCDQCLEIPIKPLLTCSK
ncbi:9629_t:CDS:1, partial [Acaulospora morrowiae]